MADSKIWGNLPRAVNDATTIDEAVATAVQAHDDDPDAHLEVGQALTTHRAAEIIDHLAESVVNDKIASIARAYTAVVGSGLVGDFDTIQSAINYVASVGGGNILLTTGTYYLSGAVSFTSNINLYGVDSESVIVHAGFTGGNYFNLVDDVTTAQIDQHISNIHFINDGGGVFYMSTNQNTTNRRMRYDYCNFTGGGSYIAAIGRKVICDHCDFELNATGALLVNTALEITNCNTTTFGTPASAYFVALNPVYNEVAQVKVDNCIFNCNSTAGGYLFADEAIETLFITNSTIYNFNPTGFDNCCHRLLNNRIILKTATALTMGLSLVNAEWCNNEIIGGAIPNVIIAANSSVFIGNVVQGQITISDTTNIVKNNAPYQNYKVAATSDTAMIFGLREVVQLTPTSTRTLTTTVPSAGSRCSLIVLTSGTLSYVLTFGTGFKTTGTLTTGTTTARRFVVEFVSDGTYLIETRRTAAIA